MLKSEVCVNGLVTRSAVAKTNSEGLSFITFGLRVDIPSHEGTSMVLDMSVSRDGDDLCGIVNGSRIEVKGTLTFRKRGDKLYLNLHASELNLSPASSTDMISGTLSFRGTIGKNVESKTDKNGKPYLLFSAFSSERINDTFEYTWVRFVFFGENTIIKPQGKIEATGELELSVYKDKLNISCRTTEVKEWIRQPFAENTESEHPAEQA